MTIDTLVAAKALEKAGMENGQAQAVATVIRDATAEQATKADLKDLRIATKADLEALQASTKAEMKALQATTKAEMKALQAATKAELNALGGSLRGELYKALWAFGLGIIGTITLVIGMAFSLALLLWPPG